MQTSAKSLQTEMGIRIKFVIKTSYNISIVSYHSLEMQNIKELLVTFSGVRSGIILESPNPL